MHRLFALLSLLVAIAALGDSGDRRVAIGVLIPEGEPDATNRWTPTANYLSEQIPGYRFEVVPLGLDGLARALDARETDFVLTSPGHHIELEVFHGVTPLLTLKHVWQGRHYADSGAVIFTRAGRGDIATLTDLRGKSFMAIARNSFWGFQLAWWEFKHHGIDPFHDFSRLVFQGFPQEDVVYAVRDGLVDAATVQTGILERMAQREAIDLAQYRILHPRATPGFPFARSTDLFPEWPLVKAAHTPGDLAQRVADALLFMPPGHPAAEAGIYAGWATAPDYQPVHEVLRELRVGPYRDTHTITFAEVMQQYGHWLLAGAVMLAVTASTTVAVLWVNRRLAHSKLVLEREIHERQCAEEALRRSADALRGLHDITADPRLAYHSKLQALLALGCSQFRLLIGILSRVAGDTYTVMEVMAPEGCFPKGTVFPLGHTYCDTTLRSSEPLGFGHASQSEWCMHPACSQCQLEAYLGIRVEVEGGVYGTLSFLSTEPRATSFSSSDKEVLRLMAQWVGSEIQRQRAAAQMHKLSSALEQTADSVMITDRDGRIEYVNPAFTRTTGYDDEEIRGQTPRILRSDVHGRDFYARLWHTIRSGEPFHAAFVNVRKNGSTYFEEKTITPLKDAQGRITHFISTGRDVTQQRLAEERARQHQAQLAHVCRVSAMGEMATTLAHELNQPLAAIVTYARGGIRWLRTRGDDSHELLGIMDHIATQGEAAGQIIRRARSLLRKDDARYLPTELNAVVREATDLARLETRRKDIALQLDLAGALPPVPADAIQIEQVVLNLVRNAIEAIDGAHPPRREIAVRTGLGANRGVEVAVFDTGPGFAATDTAHLFDPFYTTKPDGLGMGLTISRSIIEAHGGELHAAPNPDGGATFRFVLPATREGIQHDH